jgi:hypothetical protein
MGNVAQNHANAGDRPTTRYQAKAERSQARADSERATSLDERLARIEAAVATQSERSEELLDTVEAMLHEAPESAPQAGPEERPEDEGG